jgi:glycerophosphoryl diester phosphodiesterase
MPAFEAIIKMGADAIETDVRMTKDGHLVLIHDRDVKRTTDKEGFVDQMTLEEIKSLDAGFWKGEQFVGVRIPTVEEFLELVAPTDLIINWELKEYPADLGEERAFECIDKLVELIDKYGMAKRSLMNCFAEKNLEYVDEKWPHKFAIHGYPFKKTADPSSKPLVSFLDWYAIWRKDEDHLAGFPEDYAEADARQHLTCILVPDAIENYKAALDMGCRMFTSDDPRKAIEFLTELGVR